MTSHGDINPSGVCGICFKEKPVLVVAVGDTWSRHRVPARATEPGPHGNVNANTLSYLVEYGATLDTFAEHGDFRVTNDEPATGGA